MMKKNIWTFRGVTQRDLVRARKNTPWCFWNIGGKHVEGTVAQRKDSPYVSAHLKRNPIISKASKIYAIGSCFARNIEEHLIERSINVLSHQIDLPDNIYSTPARPNAILNQYSTSSMLNLLDKQSKVLQPSAVTKNLYTVPGASSIKLLDKKNIVATSAALKKNFETIKEADCVILTLGQNECWFDNEWGIHWNTMPPVGLLEKYKSRFEVSCPNFTQNHSNLNKIIQLLLALNSNMKIILTVSPIPLHVTFSGEDALLSNEYNKSVLRVIAEEVTHTFENVSYFPSYEMCRHTRPSNAYTDDYAHIKTPMVSEVVNVFFNTYVE